MAFTQQDVVDKATILGEFDTGDQALDERLQVTAEMVIAKCDTYLGYDCKEVDALLNILAEITVTQLTKYQNLQSGSTPTGATKRITRGDYTVEYDTSIPVQADIFASYEWLLKKYKKLRTL